MVHANLSLIVLRMLHAAVFEFSGIDDSTMMKDDFKLRMITAFEPIGQTHGWPLGISTWHPNHRGKMAQLLDRRAMSKFHRLPRPTTVGAWLHGFNLIQGSHTSQSVVLVLFTHNCMMLAWDPYFWEERVGLPQQFKGQGQSETPHLGLKRRR